MEKHRLEPRRAYERATHRGLHGQERIDSHRRFTLLAAASSGVRALVWVACMALVIVFELGGRGGWLDAFIHLSSTVLWVAFISYYCNAATDFAAFMAAVAALFSADAHHDVEAGRRDLEVDFTALEQDLNKLAAASGAEADRLANEIRSKVVSWLTKGET